MKALKEYVEQGRTFDYVINDLTDIPISVSLHGKCKVLSLIMTMMMMMMMMISHVWILKQIKQFELSLGSTCPDSTPGYFVSSVCSFLNYVSSRHFFQIHTGSLFVKY